MYSLDSLYLHDCIAACELKTRHEIPSNCVCVMFSVGNITRKRAYNNPIAFKLYYITRRKRLGLPITIFTKGWSTCSQSVFVVLVYLRMTLYTTKWGCHRVLNTDRHMKTHIESNRRNVLTTYNRTNFF